MIKNKTTLHALCLAATTMLMGSSMAAVNVQALDFDDLRLACQNPSRFHNQTAPSNIQVSCKDIQTKWTPDADGSYTMVTGRLVTSSIYSDKYSVSPQIQAVASPAQVAACPRYKEVGETVETVRAVSCDEIIAFKGSSIDFCAATVNTMKSSNQESIVTTETGRSANLCEIAVDPGQGAHATGNQAGN